MSIRNSFAAITIAMLVTGSTARADFSGYYDPSNWFSYNYTHGSVDTSGAPSTIVITGPDTWSGNFDWMTYVIPAQSNGTFSFDWSFVSNDMFGGLDRDWPSYIDNNSNIGLPGSSGSVSLTVAAGTNNGFAVESTDSMWGPGVLTITNFSGPVPEPTMLCALGALGLLALRRRA